MYTFKIWVFWKCSKIFKTNLNRILNSGKNRYWAFYLFFKNLGNSINTILIYLTFSCRTYFFSCLWNMERMNFCWYLPKKRSRKVFDVWKKKLMISSDSHLKSYLNRTKTREKIDFSKWDIFFRGHCIWIKNSTLKTVRQNKWTLSHLFRVWNVVF